MPDQRPESPAGAPRPRLAAVQERIGQVRSALVAFRDVSLDVPDGDRQVSRVGALGGILAERLDQAYARLALVVLDEPACLTLADAAVP